jgi:ribonuclease E
MKRMLINATQKEEMRIALVDGQKIYDLDIESAGYEQKKANIYKGVVTRLERSLEVAFVNYGHDKSGFLPLREVAPEYLTINPETKQKELAEGTEIIVQVEKEERGKKGAALTTYISLAGSYIVLMPNHPKSVGVSRRIDSENRKDLKQIINSLDVPDGMGVIIRTAGLGKTVEELNWDLDFLVKVWRMIESAANSRPAPFLIHQERNMVFRALRDYITHDISEIMIDNEEVYTQVVKHLSIIRPDFINKVHYYNEEVPLFNHFQIESQIESAYQREVPLPSGGSIVIDPTEALTSIDVNSAKATKGGDIEETALQTNLEAAEEIARQLRLRDIGGLVVIDFIDMRPIKNQREVVNRIRQAVQIDRAKIDLERISKFGLLELSRQRIRPSLGESSSHLCPLCCGQGTIRDNASLALSILRLIEEEAIKEGTSKVCARVPLAISAYLANEKRDNIEAIEKRHQCRVYIIPDETLEGPHYHVSRIKDYEYQNINSFSLMQKKDHTLGMQQNNFPAAAHDRSVAATNAQNSIEAPKQQPAINITDVVQETAPVVKKRGPSVIKRLFQAIGSIFSSSDEEKNKDKKKSSRNYKNKRNRKPIDKKARNSKQSIDTSKTSANSVNKKVNSKLAKQKKALENRPIIEETIEIKQKKKRVSKVSDVNTKITSVEEQNVELEHNVKTTNSKKTRKPKNPREKVVSENFEQNIDNIEDSMLVENNINVDEQHNKVVENEAHVAKKERFNKRNQERKHNEKTSKEEDKSVVSENTVETTITEVVSVVKEYQQPAKIGCISNVTFVKAEMTEPESCSLQATETTVGELTSTEVSISNRHAGFSAITNIHRCEMTEPTSLELEAVEKSESIPQDELFMNEIKAAGFATIKNLYSAPMTEAKEADVKFDEEIVVVESEVVTETEDKEV